MYVKIWQSEKFDFSVCISSADNAATKIIFRKLFKATFTDQNVRENFLLSFLFFLAFFLLGLGLYLSLYGAAVSHWKETKTNPMLRSTKQIHFEGKEVYLNTQIYIFGSENGILTEVACGTTRLMSALLIVCFLTFYGLSDIHFHVNFHRPFLPASKISMDKFITFFKLFWTYRGSRTKNLYWSLLSYVDSIWIIIQSWKVHAKRRSQNRFCVFLFNPSH